MIEPRILMLVGSYTHRIRTYLQDGEEFRMIDLNSRVPRFGAKSFREAIAKVKQKYIVREISKTPTERWFIVKGKK